MPKKKVNEKVRFSAFFDLSKEDERLVYEFLSSLSYGKKTKAVIDAVTALAEKSAREAVVTKEPALSEIEAAIDKIMEKRENELIKKLTKAIDEKQNSYSEKTEQDNEKKKNALSVPKNQVPKSAPRSIEADNKILNIMDMFG